MSGDVTDVQAAFSLFWAGATVVHKRSHAGRVLEVLQSAPVENRPTSYLCAIGGERHEGFITLSPEGASPRIQGNLVALEHESYSVRIDSFTGGPFEFADLVCRLLDYNYKFPPDAGVTADNLVWTKKPPPYRPPKP